MMTTNDDCGIDGDDDNNGDNDDKDGGDDNDAGRCSSPRFAKISNALFDPKKCSDIFNSLT
jgi:hypothetical protein